MRLSVAAPSGYTGARFRVSANIAIFARKSAVRSADLKNGNYRMFLFLDISGGELLLVVLAGMLLFGKDRLPGIVRGLVRGMEYVKKASQEVKEQIHAETGLQDTVDRMREEAEDIVQDIRQQARSLVQEEEPPVSPEAGPVREEPDAERAAASRAGRPNSQSTDDHVADA